MKKIVLMCVLSIAASAVMLFELGRTSAELAADSAALAALSVDSHALALRKKISAMTANEKIGQMIMVAIPDATLSYTTVAWLRTHHIGGVVLLGRNVSTSEQTVALIRDLQARARDPDDPPLFIAADQEGGVVSRFRFLKELTAQRDIVTPDEAFRKSQARAEELRALGVNVNFSPVLDVASSSADFIFGRAFRGNAEVVGILGGALIRGYKEGGVIAAAKHFPGHGGTAIDSHRSLPVLAFTDEEWRAHLAPFAAAIKENAAMIMAGHLKIAGRDDEYPASISQKIISGVLRGELGYRGVVITDDLGMSAITKHYSLPDAAVQSVKAGADIVLVVRTIADYDKIYAALLDAVQRRDIPESRINQSVSRIILLKEKFLK